MPPKKRTRRLSLTTVAAFAIAVSALGILSVGSGHHAELSHPAPPKPPEQPASPKPASRAPPARAPPAPAPAPRPAAARPSPPRPALDAAGPAFPEFVTVVLPSVVLGPGGRLPRLAAIAATYGAAARALVVVDAAAPRAELAWAAGMSRNASAPWPRAAVAPAEIGSDGDKRLRWALREALAAYGDTAAYFAVGNDHTHWIAENLACFLSRQARDAAAASAAAARSAPASAPAYRPGDEPLYAGHTLASRPELLFNSGAAGYVLSVSTLRALVRAWEPPEGACSQPAARQWLRDNPGLLLAQCCADALGAPPIDTRDRRGAHRFHAYGPVRSVTGKVDEWYKKKHQALPEARFPRPFPLPDGLGCCARTTVSFHYVEAAEHYAIHAALHDRARLDSAIAVRRAAPPTAAAVAARAAAWPGAKQLGGYAHPMPKGARDAAPIVELLERKITLCGAAPGGRGADDDDRAAANATRRRRPAR